MYKVCAQVNDVQVIHSNLNEEFQLDVEDVQQV